MRSGPGKVALRSEDSASRLTSLTIAEYGSR